MKLKITVHGVAYEVEVEVLDAGEGFPTGTPAPRAKTPSARSSTTNTPSAVASGAASASSGQAGSVASPIAGTIVEIKCKPGDQVNKGQVLLIIEAMKMKTSIAAPTAGKVKAVPIAVGDAVRESQILVEFE